VNYLNERKRFIPEQIAGIMFSKLKQITKTESAAKVNDCVIGVGFFLYRKINIETKIYFSIVRYLVFLLMLNDEQCLMLHM
jgi:hypothetical protein